MKKLFQNLSVYSVASVCLAYDVKVRAVLGMAIFGYLCTQVGYVISGQVSGHLHHLGLHRKRKFYGKNKMEARFVGNK